jgi:integrase
LISSEIKLDILLTNYLNWLRNEYRTEYGKPLADKTIKRCFLFCREDDPFIPRDPTAITSKTKSFFKKAGLPEMSPHDLRHSRASLLLLNGADSKAFRKSWVTPTPAQRSITMWPRI